jgi:phosphoribosylanthranilate isomerase
MPNLESPKIKLCGMTNIHDVRAALDLGADFIGLIFAEESPRRVNLEAAQEIVDSIRKVNQEVGSSIKPVGVFRNQDNQTIEKIIASLDLPLVQLHGEESPKQCKQVSVPVIKVFEMVDDFSWEDVAEYSDNVPYIMIDCPKSFRGDKVGWLKEAVAICSQRPESLPPLFFAGALSPENVSVVISQAKPFAVDIASGIEKEPGLKDLEKMKRFCQLVNRAVTI